MNTAEHVIVAEQVLGIAPATVLRHHRFYFAAIPRDMLGEIIACMEDVKVQNPPGGTIKIYKVCGVLHRFGSGPSVISESIHVRVEKYYKYGLEHRTDGPSFINTQWDNRGIPYFVTRHWVQRGYDWRENMPAIVINYRGEVAYADVIWCTDGLPSGSKRVWPGDPIWNEVALP